MEGLPHIVAINWPHNGLISEAEIGGTLREKGLIIAFDKLVLASTLTRDTFKVLVHRDQPDESYCFCHIRGQVTPGTALDKQGNPVTKCGEQIADFKPEPAAGAVWGAQFKAVDPLHWGIDRWGGADQDDDQFKGKTFRVVVEGDFILGEAFITLPDGRKVRPALDADHLGPGLPARCPTGDGAEGGTFLSWFRLVPFDIQDINTASRDALLRLPGVTAPIARAIIDRRRTQPFTSPEELAEISGIGRRKLETLLPYIRVGSQ